LSQFVAPVLGAAGLGKIGTKIAKDFSKREFGYDFIGLGVKLIVYFGVALLGAKYFELTNGLSGVFAAIFGVLGLKAPPNNTNIWLAKLFSDDGIFWNPSTMQGLRGLNYWKFIQFGAIVLVIWEGYRYYDENRDRASPLTLGVFFIIIFFLSLTVFPDLIQKIRESKILSKVAV
jgi:hypothetical protein